MKTILVYPGTIFPLLSAIQNLGLVLSAETDFSTSTFLIYGRWTIFIPAVIEIPYFVYDSAVGAVCWIAPDPLHACSYKPYLPAKFK